MPLYKLPKYYTPAKDKSPLDVIDPLISSFTAQFPEWSDLVSNVEHCAVNENIELLLKSLRKSDVPFTPTFRTHPLFPTALAYTERMLSCMLNTTVSPTIDVNMLSSPGKPWINWGYRTKAEAMASDLFPDAFYNPKHPLWHITTKTEFLAKEEVDDGKVRTFFIAPAEYTLQQKRLYDMQDARMKARCNDYHDFWSRYGFTKQYNGIDNLAHAHDDNFVEHEMGDVSGWDRLFPLITEVYNFREKCFLHKTPEIERLMSVIRGGLEHQHVILPDGSVYEKQGGNPSGSGKTTTDNTIGHIIIRFLFWLRFYEHCQLPLPSYDEILDNVVESLYGDDYLSSVSEKIRDLRNTHFTPDTYHEFVVSHYKLFNGMSIKRSAFRVSSNIEDMEFLGSTFVYNDRVGYYCGEPRWSKCITTLTRVLETRTPMIIISTIVSLYVQSATGTEMGDRTQLFLRQYASFLCSRSEFQSEPTFTHLSAIATNHFDTSALLHGEE